jgi:hypothetical protein
MAANGMRDLLTLLGVDRATVVGHSLAAAWRCSSPISSCARCARCSTAAASTSHHRAPHSASEWRKRLRRGRLK